MSAAPTARFAVHRLRRLLPRPVAVELPPSWHDSMLESLTTGPLERRGGDTLRAVLDRVDDQTAAVVDGGAAASAATRRADRAAGSLDSVGPPLAPVPSARPDRRTTRPARGEPRGRVSSVSSVSSMSGGHVDGGVAQRAVVPTRSGGWEHSTTDGMFSAPAPPADDAPSDSAAESVESSTRSAVDSARHLPVANDPPRLTRGRLAELARGGSRDVAEDRRPSPRESSAGSNPRPAREGGPAADLRRSGLPGPDLPRPGRAADEVSGSIANGNIDDHDRGGPRAEPGVAAAPRGLADLADAFSADATASAPVVGRGDHTPSVSRPPTWRGDAATWVASTDLQDLDRATSLVAAVLAREARRHGIEVPDT